MVRQKHCPACAGDGLCLHCEGWGSHWSNFRGRLHREPCPLCSGVGACPACDGRGHATEVERSCRLWRLWRLAGWGFRDRAA
jgi:hypothetical protein